MENNNSYISKFLASQGGFIQVNKAVIKLLGLNEAILLGELCSEYNYYESNNMLIDNELFYSTIENIEENTGLTRYQQDPAIKSLINKGIIKVVNKGLPSKRHFCINFDLLTDMLKNVQKGKKCQKIDEKEPKTLNNSVCGKTTNKNAEKPQTSMLENHKQECGKTTLNNNNITIINNDNNQSYQNTGLIEPQSMIDTIDNFSKFKKNIDYLSLKYNFTQNNSLSKCKLLDDIIAVSEELLSSNKKYISVGGQYILVTDVQNTLLKFTEDHINYVIDSLINNSKEVKNIKSYIISSLINAPKTINYYYQNKVITDFRKNSEDNKYNKLLNESMTNFK